MTRKKKPPLHKMKGFDAAKKWVILAPQLCRTAAVHELAALIGAMRERAGGKGAPVPIMDASKTQPEGTCEIVINWDEDSSRNSFAWRCGAERVEIYGHSLRSLDNAIYNFCTTLGIGFSESRPVLPAPASGSFYAMKKLAHFEQESDAVKRYCIPASFSYEKISDAVLHAGRTFMDEVIISLASPLNPKEEREIFMRAGSFHLSVARGGFELSLLVPRSLFLFHKEYFRMEEGKRRKDSNFCPSNNKTQNVIAKNAAQFFRRHDGTKKYYLLEDNDEWCFCPACRAFGIQEQKIMAVSSAARALAEADPEALIYFLCDTRETSIPLRPNMRAILSLDGLIKAC